VGTCAGAIFIARDVPGHPHPLAELMDITVRRNAFGRQLDSFEADLDVPAGGRQRLGAVDDPAGRLIEGSHAYAGPCQMRDDERSRSCRGFRVAASSPHVRIASLRPRSIRSSRTTAGSTTTS
jgi:hypothetical protein